MPSPRQYALATVLVAIAVFSSFFWGFDNRPATLQGDAYEYALLARNIADTGEFTLNKKSPSMFRDPLYPLFLSPFFLAVDSINGVILPAFAAQTALFAVLVALLYFLLRPSGKKTAFIAALLTGLAPPIAYFTGQVLSETLFIILLVAAVVVFWRDLELERDHAGFSLLAGLIFGGATLVRSATLLFPLFLGIIIFAFFRKWRRRFLLFFVGFLIIVTPWITRNAILFSTPAITIRAGYTLLARGLQTELPPDDMRRYVTYNLLGPSSQLEKNNQQKIKTEELFGFKQNLDAISALSKKGYSPEQIDKIFLRQALEKIKSHPIIYSLHSLLALVTLNAPPITVFYSRLPKLMFTDILIVMIYFFLYAVVLIHGIKIIRQKSHPLRALVMLIFAVIIYHNTLLPLFPATPRYNIPLLPFYLIIFASWLTAILQKRKLFHNIQSANNNGLF